jgi:HK97 family phage major capsid protein
MNLHELRAQVEEIRSTVVRLSEIDDITPEDDEELTAALETFEARKAELDELEARAARIEAAKAAATERHAGIDSPTILKRVEPSVLDLRTATRGELRDAALKVLETEGRGLAPHQEDHVDSLLRTKSAYTDGAVIAKRMLVTESDAYRSAFAKAVTQPVPAFDADEVRAINEFRAMSEGVDTAGGFGVPILIDPSVILTSGAAAAPVLNLARVITITTDEWKGVSSAGTSWSYDGEGVEVSDDAPTLAQPTVPVYTARGFIPFSAELGADYVGFAAEMRALLDQGYIDLVAAQTITGSGSSQPTGIFTAVDANTNAEVVVTTDGAFGAVDLLKVWKSLPERYKANASWICHSDVENEIRAFGNGNEGYYTVNLAAGGIGNLFGRPIYTTDYAPEFTGTTGAANILVVGDFSNFVVAQRAGMSVELIPHLFGATNSRPTNQRGFFATARHGFDSVNDLGFRLLQNT